MIKKIKYFLVTSLALGFLQLEISAMPGEEDILEDIEKGSTSAVKWRKGTSKRITDLEKTRQETDDRVNNELAQIHENAASFKKEIWLRITQESTNIASILESMQNLIQKNETLTKTVMELQKKINLSMPSSLVKIDEVHDKSSMPISFKKLSESDIIEALRKVEKKQLSVEKFTNLLNSDPTFTKLSLMGFGWISSESGKAIGIALQTNAALKELDLKSIQSSWNNIGNEGAVAIAEALKTNATLQSLRLGGNNIDFQGGKAIGNALKTNSTLTHLDMQANTVCDEGALALAEALSVNPTLTYLSLFGCNITDKGAMAIGNALKTNTTLKELNLGGTYFNPKSYAPLSPWYNSVGFDGAMAIINALKSNSTFTLCLPTNYDFEVALARQGPKQHRHGLTLKFL